MLNLNINLKEIIIFIFHYINEKSLFKSISSTLYFLFRKKKSFIKEKIIFIIIFNLIKKIFNLIC